MLFRPSTLLLLLLSALGALAALGSSVALQTVPDDLKKEGFGGGYWFQEVTASSATTMADAEIQAAAKTGYLAAKAAASKVKTAKFPTGVKSPPIVVALFLPGHGTVVATSIKVGEAKQSTQTCATVTWKHRNYANCAEPNSLSIAVAKGWLASAAGSAIPSGAKMAIYGKPGKTEGYQNPCADGTEKGDGCQRFLSEHPHIKLVNPGAKRAVEFVV